MTSTGENQSQSSSPSKLEERLRESLEANPGIRLNGEKNDLLPCAAVCMILKQGTSDDEVEMLLLRRTVAERDPWSGQMAFPGGRSRLGESITETVRREVREETNIGLESRELLGPMDEVRPGNLSIKVTPFIAFKHEPVDAVFDGIEIVQHFWIPVSYFMDETNSSIYSFTRNENNFNVPAFVYLGKNVIWGMTLRIIEEFIARIR
jgi:8-oxo-dGTP pyrophosphatase MutT (NUDIX family)